MANAEKIMKRETVARVVTEVKEVDAGVTLTLSRDEAQMLAQTLGCFGGEYETPAPRRHQMSVKKALEAIGYYWSSERHEQLFRADNASIYFEGGAKWEPVL